MDYKTQFSLNEKDALTDLLTAEKAIVKLYALAITEGCSNGFRTVVKKCLDRAIESQIGVFFDMTEHGYYKVSSATKEETEKAKENFMKIKKELC